MSIFWRFVSAEIPRQQLYVRMEIPDKGLRLEQKCGDYNFVESQEAGSRTDASGGNGGVMRTSRKGSSGNRRRRGLAALEASWQRNLQSREWRAGGRREVEMKTFAFCRKRNSWQLLLCKNQGRGPELPQLSLAPQPGCCAHLSAFSSQYASSSLFHPQDGSHSSRFSACEKRSKLVSLESVHSLWAPDNPYRS